MKPLLSIVLAACLPMSLAGCVSGPVPVPMSGTPPDAAVLVGTWRVDLRPKPGAPDYYQAFVVSSVSGNSFTGVFYGTPIVNGRINVDWGAVRIGFVTADASGQYDHSAVLSKGRLEGLTLSEGRGFLAYWSAERP